MLSVAIKTSIVFFLVVIIIHLMIRKAINERLPHPSPPCIQRNEPQEDSDLSSKGAYIATEKVNPIMSQGQVPQTCDDLFDFVYKKKGNQTKVVECETIHNHHSTPTQALHEGKKDANTKEEVKGICTFEDENFGMYSNV